MWQHPLDEATGERSGVNVVLQPSGGLVDCVVPRLLVPTVPCFHAKLLSGEATRSLEMRPTDPVLLEKREIASCSSLNLQVALQISFLT